MLRKAWRQQLRRLVDGEVGLGC